MIIKISSAIKKYISIYILLPIFWKLKKIPVLSVYNKYASRQWDTVDVFNNRQKIKLKKILEAALDTVGFYSKYNTKEIRDLIDSDVFLALSKFPILTKGDLYSSLDNLHAELGKDAFLNSSGGSTGEPVKFYQNKQYLCSVLATKLTMYSWAGLLPGEHMIKLWGAERDLIKNGIGFKQRATDLLNNITTINAFRLSPVRMMEYVDQINSKHSTCIEGYAESLYDFALFIEKLELKVLPPRSIISSAGTLHPYMRELIQKVFSAEVFDRYGSREAGDMAAECELHNGLHIFGETSILEIVDELGAEVSEGEEGELLVTNLTNFTMPLIRYKIGDRAVKGKLLCGCGRPYPMLEKISGRSGSSFKTKEGGVVSPEFFIHLIGVMCNQGAIGKFQVIQESIDKINIRLVAAPGASLYNWDEKEKVVNLIQNVMGEDCVVNFKYEDDIEPTVTGKHLYTICQLK